MPSLHRCWERVSGQLGKPAWWTASLELVAASNLDHTLELHHRHLPYEVLCRNLGIGAVVAAWIDKFAGLGRIDLAPHMGCTFPAHQTSGCLVADILDLDLAVHPRPYEVDTFAAYRIVDLEGAYHHADPWHCNQPWTAGLALVAEEPAAEQAAVAHCLLLVV